MIGTAPCVACGERVPHDEPACGWKRERAIWTPVAELQPGDLVALERGRHADCRILGAEYAASIDYHSQRLAREMVTAGAYQAGAGS